MSHDAEVVVRRGFLRIMVVATAASLWACGAGTAGEVVRGEAPTAGEALGEETKPACDAVPDYGEPLIVDLDSQARLDLELAMKDGVPVVRYDCDGLALLKRCRLGGSFGYAGVSIKEDVLRLKGRDEVRVNLPISGAKLASDLERGTSLDLALALVGKRTTTLADAAAQDLDGACDGATHFVQAATVGAFAMTRSSDASVSAAADIFGATVGGGSSSDKSSSMRDGVLDDCRKADPAATEPPGRCRSAIRLELVPLAAQASSGDDGGAPTAPGPMADPCPEGFTLAGGKCAPVGGDEAQLCAPGDEPGCQAQCDKGSAGSCYHLALLYQGSKGVVVSGGSERATKAAPFFDKACDGGNPAACFYVGARFEYGALGETAKVDQAIEHYQRACLRGHGSTCLHLAMRFDRPEAGWKKDAARAVNLYQRACDLGVKYACFQVIGKYLRGDGTDKSPAKARSLLERTCRDGHAKRCAELGLYILEGHLGEKNVDEAVGYLDQGCTMGRSDACFFLARGYAEGTLLPKDLDKARAYLPKGCPSDKAEKKACTDLAAQLK